MAKNESGSFGEQTASDFLIKNGCSVPQRNFRCRYGEIDIIAKDSNYIVFVEVKTRLENSLFLPREAVDAKKQMKLIKTAEMYLSQNDIGSLQPRFDVIEVVVSREDKLKVLKIEQIKNAFTL